MCGACGNPGGLASPWWRLPVAVSIEASGNCLVITEAVKRSFRRHPPLD
jgi:hypothetical protein